MPVTTLIRFRQAAVAVKAEVTPGTDSIAGTPATGDWVAGSGTLALNPIVISDPSFTGSMDAAVDSVGGFKPTLTLQVPFRGSGTAGTEPGVAKLLKACTMAVTTTAAAVGVPTAAAAGTTTTVTAATPFGTTADAYNGMPLIVAGDQSFTTGIVDYTAARVISMGETRTALTTDSDLQIPINNIYRPTSDEAVFTTTSIYLFHDGIRYRLTGCQGTWSLEMTAGGSGIFTFTLTGQLSAAPDSTVLPAGAAAALSALPTAPVWMNGRSQINLGTARVRTFRLDFGVQSVLPDNPESIYGFDPGVPIGRRAAGSIDPLADTATHVAMFAAMSANTAVPYFAILGSTAGNRMLVMVAAMRMQGMDLAERDGLGAHNIPFQADGPDAGCSLCFF